MKTTTLKRINSTLDNMIDHAERTIAKFQKRLAENPADAFEWGEDAAEAAAALQVATWLKRFCSLDTIPEKHTEDDLVNAVRETVLSRMVLGAQSPKQSTSPFANLMDRYTTKAWAGLADLFL